MKYLSIFFLFAVLMITACKKDPPAAPPTTEPPPPPPPPPTTVLKKLKEAFSFPIGTAIDYTPFKNNATYRNIAKEEFDLVTFGWNMKHGALVKYDGAIDFTSSDELVSLANSNGLQVFGHTLFWHENQNAQYLNNMLSAYSGSGSNLVENPGFETTEVGSLFVGWKVQNQINGTFSVATSTEARTGNTALKAVVNSSGDAWATQILGNTFTVNPGASYVINYWVKGAAAGSIQLEVRKSDDKVSYFGGHTVTSDWKMVSLIYDVPAGVTTLALAFDLGAAANTIYIDDISVKLKGTVSPTNPDVIQAVDDELKRFVTQTATHYKGKVKAWDVVNEPVVETGHVRTSANTSSTTANDRFFWADYLGRDAALKAFKYAEAADPAALLFINDFNLESNPRKLDSLIKYVTELKGKGAKIDGIGTQMHVLHNGSKANIDAMFQKLAATGLLIRISELDVRMNPSLTPGFTLTAERETAQAEVYDYIIRSYIKYIPAAQRHGITIWGISDDLSWLYKDGLDYPLLFKKDFSKKKAYEAVVKAAE